MENKQLEEGDVVLCTVDRIVGTIVFVKIHHPGETREGSIIFSEVAPGRIRNIRNYIVPKKKIVCKVLRVKEGQIHLSLRRVSQEERKEVMNQFKLEKSYKSIIKNFIEGEEKAEKIIKEMQNKGGLYNFIENAKENPEELEKIAGKDLATKILEKIKKEKKKVSTIKKEFLLKTNSGEGMKEIKSLLDEIQKNNANVEIKYISAGKYSIKATSEGENIKKLDQKVQSILSEIQSKSKEKEMEFESQEKHKR